MDIVELKDAFTANQFTFETNYKGRIFEIVGVIDDIRRTYDNTPVIVLGLAEIEKAALSATGAYGYTLDCHFNNAKQVVELSKGQEVTVTGLYTDGDLKLMGCNIVTDPGD